MSSLILAKCKHLPRLIPTMISLKLKVLFAYLVLGLSLCGAVQAERAPTSPIRPDIVGLRSIMGVNQSQVPAKMNIAQHTENHTLFGVALASEWSMLHHHLELELILGMVSHEGETDELGELVFKAPIHLSQRVDLLFGFGGVLETNHERTLTLGMTLDVEGRIWTSEHWGIGAEYDFVKLQNSIVNHESIFEVVYRI